MTVSQPQNPDSSEQRWERIERTLDRIAERQDALTMSLELAYAEQQEHKREAEQFKRTMAAVIESLHQTNQRLDANLARLSVIAVDHDETIDELQARLAKLEKRFPPKE